MQFRNACSTHELQEGRGKCVTLEGKRIALFRAGGKVLAIDDTCTHDEASLAEGTVTLENGKCIVECPWHGAHFDLCSGAALTLPAVTPVNPYATREVNGVIEVEI
jgi:nitrite reductase/ring-hydroxylating ferredoxin subunit